MQEETQVVVDVSLFEDNGREKQINIMDPKHVAGFDDLDEALHELLIDVFIGVPERRIRLINFILIRALEVME